VVPRIPVEGEPPRGGEAAEETAEEGHLAHERPAGDHLHVLGGEGEEEPEVVVLEEGDRVAEGEIAAGRVAAEAAVVELGAVEVHGGGPLGVEEVGLDHLDLDELAQARDLGLEGDALPPAEEVRLADLRGPDEALDGGEAG